MVAVNPHFLAFDLCTAIRVPDYDLAMPPPPTTGSHFVVCGDNPLAYRIARELTRRYGEYVVVLARRQAQEPRTPDRRPARRHRPRARRAGQRGVRGRGRGLRPGDGAGQAPTTSPTSTRRCARRNSIPTCGSSSPRTTGGSAITSPGSSATARCCRAASLPRPRWWPPRSARSRRATSGCRAAPCTWRGAATPVPVRCCAGSRSPTTRAGPPGSSHPRTWTPPTIRPPGRPGARRGRRHTARPSGAAASSGAGRAPAGRGLLWNKFGTIFAVLDRGRDRRLQPAHRSLATAPATCSTWGSWT